MKKSLPFLLFIYITSCDPGYSVRSSITNETGFQLRVNYHAPSLSKDSELIIQPNSNLEIYHYGALGEGRDYDCCSCEFSPITLILTDTSKHLIKNISDSANWNLTNTNRKRFDSHEITCEFVVKQSDIE